MRHSKPALAFILVTLMLDVLGFGLLIPVAPKLIQHLQGGTEADAATPVWILTTIYAAMQFIFSPMLGVLSDMVGRRPVLLISLFGSGLDYFAMALSPSLMWLYITRALNGISGASMTTANAYIADVTPPEKRAAAFGMVGAAFGIGFILGPLAGGFLGAINIHLPFYVAGGITLLNWLYGCFVLPESLPIERRKPFVLKRINPVGAIPTLSHYPLAFGLAVAMFLTNLAQFGVHVTWVLYTGHRYGWGPKEVGASLGVVGLMAAIVQGGLARKFIPRVGEKRALFISFFIAVLTYAGYGLATEGWMLYVVIVLGSLAGLGAPAAQSLITRTVRPDEQGAVQGALTSLQSAANILGPAIAGSVFKYAISAAAVFHLAGYEFRLPGMSFLVGSALAGLGWIVAGVTLMKSRITPVVQAEVGAAQAR